MKAMLATPVIRTGKSNLFIINLLEIFKDMKW